MSRGINNGRYRREERRLIASEKDMERQKRSPEQQLALLDKRLGAGVGASRERARLKRMMSGVKSGKKKQTSDKTTG